jgi:hypothetical protein
MMRFGMCSKVLPGIQNSAGRRLFLRVFLAVWLLGALLAGAQSASQRPLPDAAQATRPPHRTRLILKDGSYQLVMSYRIEGSTVHYVSAERAGQEEDIPLALVDLPATKRYEKAHAPAEEGAAGGQDGKPPVLDPELARDEADRASRTPEVAPDLRLDTEDAVLLLDTFQGSPELVPLVQTGGDLNRSTGHSILKSTLNPMASSHQIVEIKGTRAPVQAHVDTPVLYLRVGDDTGAPTGSAPLVVDTHGAQGNAPVTPSGGAATSDYVIVRADVRRDIRILMSFRISALGSTHRQEDVVETTSELLPGGHWMKLTPKEPLGFGEYALMEVISDRDVNLGVWDFGVHPTAPDNRDALHPEPKRPATLERHSVE